MKLCYYSHTLSPTVTPPTPLIIIIIIIIIILTVKGIIWDLNKFHCATNCLQHVRSSRLGAIVCYSHAAHLELIRCNLIYRVVWFNSSAAFHHPHQSHPIISPKGVSARGVGDSVAVVVLVADVLAAVLVLLHNGLQFPLLGPQLLSLDTLISHFAVQLVVGGNCKIIWS